MSTIKDKCFRRDKFSLLRVKRPSNIFEYHTSGHVKEKEVIDMLKFIKSKEDYINIRTKIKTDKSIKLDEWDKDLLTASGSTLFREFSTKKGLFKIPLYELREDKNNYYVNYKKEGVTILEEVIIPKEDIISDKIFYDFESGGCYVTTACTQYMGLPDNCFELKILRGLRDRMMQKPQGKQLIHLYYQKAPTLVRLVNQHPKADRIWKWSYEQIQKAVDLTIKSKYDEAIEDYKKTVFSLTKLI